MKESNKGCYWCMNFHRAEFRNLHGQMCDKQEDAPKVNNYLYGVLAPELFEMNKDCKCEYYKEEKK